MKHVVMSVFDKKADAFIRPFLVPTVRVGARAFQSIILDSTSDLHQFPDDYNLMELGTFDDNSGVYENLKHPKFIANGSSFARVVVVDAGRDNSMGGKDAS